MRKVKFEALIFDGDPDSYILWLASWHGVILTVIRYLTSVRSYLIGWN